MDDPHEHNQRHRARWAFWLFFAVAAFFLLLEHRAHLFGILPYVFVLACPLMHLFHRHGGHRHHHHQDTPGEADKSSDPR